MRITIETNVGIDQDVLNYLRLVEGQEREELAARLLDFKTVEELKEAFQDLPYHDLFELVNMEDCFSTLGIRLKLLDSAANEEKKIEEDGGI